MIRRPRMPGRGSTGPGCCSWRTTRTTGIASCLSSTRSASPVDVAVDAEDGLRRDRGREYAGAIVDLNLSDASRCEGFGLIARLRKRGRRYPVVIVSHNRGVEYEIRGFGAGADDYMVKWPTPEEMRTRLRTLLIGAAVEAPNPRPSSVGP